METKRIDVNYITSATRAHQNAINELNVQLWQIVQEIRNKRQNIDGLNRFDDAIAETLATASDQLDNALRLLEKLPF